MPKRPFGSIESRHGVDEPGFEPRAEPPEPSPGPPREPKRWHEWWSVRALVVLVLVFLFVAWRAGTFDHALYPVGLNAKPCARNGFGAVFCGKELTEYRNHIEGAEREGKEAGEKVQREETEALHGTESPEEESG